MSSFVSNEDVRVVFEAVEPDFIISGVVRYGCHQRVLISIQGGRIDAERVHIFNLKVEGAVFGDFGRPCPWLLHIVCVAAPVIEGRERGKRTVVGRVSGIVVMHTCLVSFRYINIGPKSSVDIWNAQIFLAARQCHISITIIV